MSDRKKKSDQAGSPDTPDVPFEKLLSDLEAVVDDLERGELPLEEALKAFERGMGLADKAGAILDAAELRIEKLIEDRDGNLREVPFDQEQ